MLLLSHRCADSFSSLKRTADVEHATFREGALALGLLDSDDYLETTLTEATTYQMPIPLRRLFATILVYCSPSNPKALWEKFKHHLIEDFANTDHQVQNFYAIALHQINEFLVGLGRSLHEFNIVADLHYLPLFEYVPTEMQYEHNIAVLDQDLKATEQLNTRQIIAFRAITDVVYNSKRNIFFVDGAAGTGKTFLYQAILANIRAQGHIAIAVATSGVAASLLPGGRTTHSRFKIPLDLDMKKTCKVSKQSGLAKLLLATKLILWDEISMARNTVVHALDAMLRDITDCSTPFGGKVVVFGGDFRQIAPVVPNGQMDNMIVASFVSSPLFRDIIQLELVDNMHAKQDAPFAYLLQQIGNGSLPYVVDDKVAIPDELIYPFVDHDSSLSSFTDMVFPNLHNLVNNPISLVNRAILCPTNDAVDEVNDILLNKMPGCMTQYYNIDTTKHASEQVQYEDYLHVLSPSGLPPHILKLKPGCPIMLLRNLNPIEGLCNGTRLFCKGLQPRVIHAEICMGPFKGKETFIPRIPLECTDLSKTPVPFTRIQFPVRPCFSMTINKAQGQTISFVGIYLREPVFSHGQLYVALSRAQTSNSVCVLIKPSTIVDAPTNLTSNIVYLQLLQLVSQLRPA